MRRALAVLTVSLFALAGCGGDDDSGGGAAAQDPTTGAATPADGPSDAADTPSEAADSPSEAADSPSEDSGGSGDGATGCDLVTAEMIQTALGVDPGAGTGEPSNIDGPDGCMYADLAADVQVSNDPDTYVPDDVWCQADAAPAPDASERGCVTDSSFLVVKDGVGVLMTAFASGDTTQDQWTALAEATVAKL